MKAKRLEALVAQEVRNTNVAQRTEAEMVQRFQSLREFGMLPKSRGRNAENLSHEEIAAAILSTVTNKPGFSGVAAKLLTSLLPVGGVRASFEKAENFGKALATIFENSDTFETLVEVRASDSEFYTNGHGRGAIVYRKNDVEKTSYYVGKTAVSLLSLGAEKDYNPRDLISCAINESVFLPRFFEKIKRELEREKMYKVPFSENLKQANR